MATDWRKNYQRYRGLLSFVLKIYNTKPNLKIYLELILSLSIITIFIVFAIKPTVLTIISLTKEIAKKEETVTQLKQKITNLQTANTVLQKETEKLALIDQAVPDTANPEVLAEQIELIANSQSLQILSFSVSDIILIGKDEGKKKAKEYENLPNNANELPFTISLTGSYQGLFEFLKIVENLKRPLKIDTLTLNSNTIDTGKVLVMTVSGRTPFLYKYEEKK